MDPHKKTWQGCSGQKYNLTHNTSENSDSFAPFRFANSCSLKDNQIYLGTLFRFPLRNEPSDISSKVYTVSKIKAI